MVEKRSRNDVGEDHQEWEFSGLAWVCRYRCLLAWYGRMHGMKNASNDSVSTARKGGGPGEIVNIRCSNSGAGSESRAPTVGASIAIGSSLGLLPRASRRWASHAV